MRDAGQDGVDQKVGALLVSGPVILGGQQPHAGVEAQPGGFDVLGGRDQPQFGRRAFDGPFQLRQRLLGGPYQDQGLELGGDVRFELAASAIASACRDEITPDSNAARVRGRSSVSVWAVFNFVCAAVADTRNAHITARWH